MLRYLASYQYRSTGAARAAEYGALAVLVRSGTNLSLYTPHTGVTYYGNGTKIPAAAITAEDATIIARHYRKGTAAAWNGNSGITSLELISARPRRDFGSSCFR